MNIKSSQTLVEEAKKNIETLTSNQAKSLFEKKRNYINRCEGYQRALERGCNRKFKTHPKRNAGVLVRSRKLLLQS